MKPLNILTFKWKSPLGYRSTFTADHVNVLGAMIRRHYQRPHRLWCVTDDAEGIDQDIGIVPLWNDHARVPNPHAGNHPSCYRRLKLFDPETAAMFGPRLVWLDLDCVIVGDVAPLWDRPEQIVTWGMTNPSNPINGSMVMLEVGARPEVWTRFHPVQSPILARNEGYFGSDQAWLSYILGDREARWTKADGVVSYRLDCKPHGGRLPDGARVVFMHGQEDPWSPGPQRLDWVKAHYR